MSDVTEKSAMDAFTRDSNETPVKGHDAWVRERIQKRLDKKASGKAVYHSLDDVMEKFGFNAR